MRILKQGDINRAKTIYEGTCGKCGTVFEADPNEVEDDQRERETYCFCPVCKAGVAVRVKRQPG